MGRLFLFKPSQRAKSYLNDFEYIIPKNNYSFSVFIIQHIVIDHQDAKSNQENVLTCSFIYSHLSYKKDKLIITQSNFQNQEAFLSRW